ncbi:hypothetical protein CEP54_012879 [Fusarium duplospermum]|uniref:Uncharacterized protein n=1 Tax=Fusarium duplospermum TaxID=1325734 RepID=A0A428P647_9HYPO|nr:hypothetical protein CEP54_012879 [Fusarium duplospermum]
MVLLSYQLSCILAGLFSAAVVLTAPTAPVPSDDNSFTLDVAAYVPVKPVTQRPPPSQPNTNPANRPPPVNRPPPASPATPYTPAQDWRQKSKPDRLDGDGGGGGSDPPEPEPSIPSDSESSTYRVTEKEKSTSTNKQKGTSTTTELKPSESASTSVLASISTIFGAITAVIVWLLV